MSGIGLGASISPSVQKRSIVEALHELQRQIQAYGQGPFTPEQAKELENLKILYIKAKQQYEKQIKLLQASSMANQPTTLEATMAAGATLPISSTQTIGITSVPNSQQLIKEQQASIIHQLQHSASISSQSTTQSLMNAQVLGQQALQIVGSVSTNLIATSGTLAMASVSADSSGKNQIVPPSSNKQLVVSRPQTTIRPALTSVNMVPHTLPAGVSSITAQQQLKLMGITANQRPEAHGVQQSVATVKQQPGAPLVNNPQPIQVLSRRKLQDLLHEIDPRETMDEDVEEVLLQIADDFIENVVGSACQLAKHRKSNTLEIKDIQLHLDRHWNMWVPGFGNEDLRPHKKVPIADAHRQRLAMIKKSLKK